MVNPALVLSQRSLLHSQHLYQPLIINVCIRMIFSFCPVSVLYSNTDTTFVMHLSRGFGNWERMLGDEGEQHLCFILLK